MTTELAKLSENGSYLYTNDQELRIFDISNKTELDIDIDHAKVPFIADNKLFVFSYNTSSQENATSENQKSTQNELDAIDEEMKILRNKLAIHNRKSEEYKRIRNDISLLQNQKRRELIRYRKSISRERIVGKFKVEIIDLDTKNKIFDREITELDGHWFDEKILTSLRLSSDNNSTFGVSLNKNVDNILSSRDLSSRVIATFDLSGELLNITQKYKYIIDFEFTENNKLVVLDNQPQLHKIDIYNITENKIACSFDIDKQQNAIELNDLSYLTEVNSTIKIFNKDHLITIENCGTGNSPQSIQFSQRNESIIGRNNVGYFFLNPLTKNISVYK